MPTCQPGRQGRENGGPLLLPDQPRVPAPGTGDRRGLHYLLNDVEREKRWMETKWARQEKEIRKIIDSTQGIYGNLQAVTGRSLPTIAALELPEMTAATDVGNALSEASAPIAT